MKKQLILSLALLVMAFSFAQKKEVKALEKAVKNKNYAEAKTMVSSLEPMTDSMDDKIKTKYYIAAAKALYSNGTSNSEDVLKATKMLGMVSNQKNEAVVNLKKVIENDLLAKGNELYSSKKFSQAVSVFENLFSVTNDNSYLYYAAVSSINAQDMDTALGLYLKLNEQGYTGVETEYYATNKETGKEEVLTKSQRDLYVKAKSHIKPGQRETKSKVGEITRNIALIYSSKGESEKALEAMKTAREANPDDTGLIVSEANLHYKLGNVDKYKELIDNAIKKDPNNSDLLFNLGVVANDTGDREAAINYYKKAISINPDFINALTNLSVVILAKEQTIINEMNKLGSSAADNRKYDELKLKRTDVYKEAIPYLEKVLNLKEDKDIAKTLMNIYSMTGEDDKFKALKAKYN